MRLKPLAFSAVLLASSAAYALDTAKAGKLEAQMEERRAQIKKEYGDRDPSKMSKEERRSYAEKIEAANREVLQKNGISDKDYARQTARMGRGSMQEIEKAKKEYQEKKAAEEKAKAEKGKGSGEIQVQRGFGDNRPVTLDDDGSAGPEIETGTGDDM
ncbi:MAG: hypothetical protein ACK4N5_07350 [Myxococcales bacterium]